MAKIRYTTKKRTTKYNPPSLVAKKASQALARVNKIKKELKDTYEIQHLQYRINKTNLAEPYVAFNLCNYNTMRSIFGTSGGDYSGCNKWKLLSMDLDLIFDQNSEAADVDFSMYLVTLKKSAVAYYNSTTGALNTLTAGVDYSDNDSATNNGTATLNPFLFTVHKKARFAIGNNNVAGLAGTGIAGTTYVANRKRFNWHIKINKEMRNPAGNMSTLQASQDPTSQYYLIVFNNNASGDFENPNVEINAINKIKVPN